MILGGYNRLFSLTISSDGDKPNSEENILQRMINRKKMIYYCLKKH